MKYREYTFFNGTAKSALLLGVAAFALSGCLGSSSSGGGSVGGGGSLPAPTPGSLIGDRQAPGLAASSQLASDVLAEGDLDGVDAARITALLTAVEAAGSAVAPEGSALTGTASYTGDFAMQEIGDGDGGLLGDFAMSVSFDDGSLTGSLGNEIIVDDENGRFIATGSASINGSVTNDTMNATLTGVYTAGGESAQIDGRMAGQFVGAGAETVAGGMTAAVSDLGDAVVYEGIFAGSRAAP